MQRCWYETLLDRDLIPDWMMRAAIQRILTARLRHQSEGAPSASRPD